MISRNLRSGENGSRRAINVREERVLTVPDRVRHWEKKWVTLGDTTVRIYKWIPVSRPPEPRVEAGTPGELSMSRRALALKPKAFKSRSPLAAGSTQAESGPRAEELLKHLQGGSLGLGGVAQHWNGAAPPPDGAPAPASSTPPSDDAPPDISVTPVPPVDSTPAPTATTKPASPPTPTVASVPPETQETPNTETPYTTAAENSN